MKISFAGVPLKNRLVAASSPLTESEVRLAACRDAGFGAAILKSCAPYSKTGVGHGRKVVYIDDDYYADASFEREIMTVEEGVSLYESAYYLNEDMFLIPSVSANSLDPEDWFLACRRFEEVGAKLIQLDFFYLGNLLHDNDFYDKLRNLLIVLIQRLKCFVMPKLNINFEPDQICNLLTECKVQHVSLLDSMRQDLPEKYGLHKGTTSYFGSKQFPYTMQFLVAAKKVGLHICAGGGVAAASDVLQLGAEGAELIQIASYVLKRGYLSVRDFLDSSPRETPLLKHNPWCDVEDGAVCEQCGACRRVSN